MLAEEVSPSGQQPKLNAEMTTIQDRIELDVSMNEGNVIRVRERTTITSTTIPATATLLVAPGAGEGSPPPYESE